MSVLFMNDEQKVEGVIDFMDLQYPTTVWWPGADGSWVLSVMTTVDDVSYFGAVVEDMKHVPGDEVAIRLRRRKFRFARKWKIIEAIVDDTDVWLRPVIH